MNTLPKIAPGARAWGNDGTFDYHVFKSVLFEFPTYEYFVMGDKIGNCGKMNQ